MEPRKKRRVQTAPHGEVMLIGGLQKFSLIDYPGKICAVLFSQGCNFRCKYCHNPELVYPEKYLRPYDKTDIFHFLRSRTGKLDGVVITGGEPTLQPGLEKFIREIRDMSFLVKLDTNGSNPKALKNLVDKNLIDFIAMDIKAPFHKYNNVTCCETDLLAIKDSIELLRYCKIPHQFRITFDKTELRDEDIVEVRKLVADEDSFIIQPCLAIGELVK